MEDQQINVGGAAATLGWDDGDGTREFLSRTKYKSKIDQVIDFYGVPYCYKNNINQFLKYGVQPRHYPICHDHFYTVLKSTGYGVDDFDYGKLQDDYNLRQEKGPGIDYKMPIENFKKQEQEQKELLSQDVMATMKTMMEEIKSLKLLSLNKLNDGKPDTAGKSETSKESERGSEENGSEGSNKGIGNG